MTGYEFIFSDKPGQRLYRHFAFWLVLLLHFIVQNLMVGGVNEALRTRNFIESAYNALFFFPAYILLTYSFIYWVLPTFLFRGRYVLFFNLLLTFVILDFVICYYSGMLYVHISERKPFNKITFDANKYNAIVNGVFLPVMILGISSGIKIAKKWYPEQRESERLAREKISNELLLLKMQLHPRFLFHSLRAVKKHIRSSPSMSTGLIIQLSELLSYILYNSDQKYLSIEKETGMIKSYIDLEEKSAEEPLATDVSFSGDPEGKYVSPLLLLSLVEICFDCVLKDHPKNRSLKLSIAIGNDYLNFHLFCKGFLDSSNDSMAARIKFFSIEKQLHLLYPDNHHIDIKTEDTNISVTLKLPVHKDAGNDINTVFQNELYELL